VRTLVRDGGAALELLRISCNPIESLPEELWSDCCPRLAWFGCAGSPYHQRHAEAALALVSAEEGVEQLADGSEVEVGAELGRGSGAVVREGAWRAKAVAVKVWHGANPTPDPTPTPTPTPDRNPNPNPNPNVALKVWHDACSSDGLARDEWQMGQLTGGCPDLVRALADNLTPSQRDFVNLRYGLLDGRIRSISKCAEIMKLTRSKVSTMDKKCLKTLREAGTRGKLEEYLVLV